MVNVILCGGSGTRLWPLSRNAYPKQFVDLVDGDSLFRKTVRRNAELCESFIVVTNSQHVFIAAGQFQESSEPDKRADFYLEPIGRNTAPAIALACFALDPETVVLVSPSDHLISDETAYRERTAEAASLAAQGYLVTYGIKPGYPETGYGYIETDKTRSLDGKHGFPVLSFREKPDESTAAAFLKAGAFLWNSGMFVFKAGTYLEELRAASPTIYETSKKAFENAAAREDEGLGHKIVTIGLDDMKAIPADSIDYAVMEKSTKVACVESSFMWNDLGSFDSLYDIRGKDEAGNTVDRNLIQYRSKNNLVVSSGRKIALVGLDDCIIIDTEDSILVARRGESQHVKQIVDALKKGGPKDRELTEVHATVYRPWGSYTLLDESGNFKIKRIVVRPGKKLSLQKHMHRSEHWVVVSGTATVTIDEETRTVRTNESAYIPIACVHRLENEGKIDLSIIETQVGQYLGEDDIIRLDDDYGRI